MERLPGYLLLDRPTRSLPVRVEVVLRERAWKVRRKDRGRGMEGPSSSGSRGDGHAHAHAYAIFMVDGP
jgi:hypothetical protein